MEVETFHTEIFIVFEFRTMHMSLLRKKEKMCVVGEGGRHARLKKQNKTLPDPLPFLASSFPLALFLSYLRLPSLMVFSGL